MKVIGLTGGIGSGKSTVSHILKKKGMKIIDADQIARDIVMPGQQALKEIVEYFGTGILNEDKTLNRKKLGEIVFSNPVKLEFLNKIMHEKILEMIQYEIQNAQENGIVVDAALLIEAGMNHLVDEIWLVAVSESTQIERVRDRDGIETPDILKKIATQMPLKDKMKYADHIIDNNKDLAYLEKQVNYLLEKHSN